MGKLDQLDITMLGPSGVGKTSLLTVMYDRLEQVSDLTNLQLIPDSESKALLAERLQELKTLSERFKVTPDLSIKNTEVAQYFTFKLAKKGQKPNLQLKFADYPGGYVSEKASVNEKTFVKNLLETAQVVIIAIDTPALMMLSGRWHDRINKPQQITSMFKDVYRSIDSPRLVIFAPVKCERNMQDPIEERRLLESLKKEYASLLNFFKSPNLIDQVAVVVAPVQTVGCIKCGRVEEFKDGRPPTFYFQKRSYDAEFKPKDSEQPLRYLLRFVLKIYLQKRKESLFGLGQFLDWLGRDAELKAALIKFAKGSKTTGGFAVLQGQELLEI